MRTLRAQSCCPAWLVLGSLSLIGVFPSGTRSADDTVAAPQILVRPGQPGLEGRLLADGGPSLKFTPRGESAVPVALPPGAIVQFAGREPSSTAIPPLFQVQMGQTARISGTLRRLDEKSLVLSVPWQASELTIVRHGAQALVQRPGEAGVFAESFEKLDPTRWIVEGKVEPVPAGGEPGSRPELVLAAEGASITHRLAEPLGSGRLELAFHDDGRVATARRWTLGLTFVGPGGPATVRVVLGWAEESLAVESPDGPSLAVQRLARTPGWHRLMVRFGPEQTEIAVDGMELAHGRGPAGPLQAMTLATSPGVAGSRARISELQLVRFAEPPASLEIDATQDEARLVVGDQLFGKVERADFAGIVMEVAGRALTLSWGEVAGLHFRRQPVASRPVVGAWARVEWRAAAGASAREPDFAEGVVAALSDSALTFETPYCGTLTLPATRLVRLRMLEPGWRQVLDPSAHHLGDEIKGPPTALDPPAPEGGVLERSFALDRLGIGPLWLSLDVRDVVGETGSPFSQLIQKGEIRTHVLLNGTRIDTLNRHITTVNDTPERIRIALPQEHLKAGINVVRLEQTGTAAEPTAFDDLEVLQIAIERTTGGPAAKAPPTSP